ncbi:DUF4136 domain-containing protein [Sphingomonas quercus]|uniref:DUF4136 domain-containing protein n=1 Tax=Sphingomonas quercus TaxID=2842451 RepID=A0ABS6BML8_9SPHN|nr:DUF4136 domain-containing protein [Sphingomonas quercus]MBU3079092.1 DUF4136 domain-containing protein [Sphingomonas quercus]
MSIRKSILAVAAPLSMLALGACATSFKADVARFQQLPPAQGQTFFIEAGSAEMQGGLEFQTYASLVSQRLTQYGYRPAESRDGAQLVVALDYGVDNGRQQIVSRPAPFYGPYGGGWGGGWGRWGRFGGWGGYRPFYPGGWGAWGSGWGGWGGTEIDSYTYYTSFLDMRISRAADGARLFEGHAKARSANDRLTELVPNLVDAMFAGFPGRSGEEVRITIPPKPKG